MNEQTKELSTDTAAAMPAPVAPPVSAFSSIEAFEGIQRMAQLLASSKLIPTEYQNNIPNCVIAMEMAAGPRDYR